MYKRIVLGSLIFVVAAGLIFGLGILRSFAEEETGESLTITTYYPSPYGSYNQLEVYRSVTYKPLASTPTTEPREGELVYVDSDPSDSTPGQFYYYGGGTWVAQGGGGGTAVMYLSCAWGRDAGAGGGHGWDGSCTPPKCPSGWTSAATFSEPLSVACPGGGSCDWGEYTAGSGHPVVVGRSVRVCVK